GNVRRCGDGVRIVSGDIARTRSGNSRRPNLVHQEVVMKLRRALYGLVVSFSILACNKAPTESPKPAETAAPAPPARSAAPAALPDPKGPALKIAYSDWPGWIAWDIGIQKGWFKEAGVAVDFGWFDYVPSMDAFSAGKVDAVTVTNGDALVTGSSGAPSKCIM